MKRYLLLLICVSLCGSGLAAEKARNVILFLGDAGGIPTLNAAGIYANDRPQSLFIQHMEHFALSDTSSLNRWVTDSAAGMTAIVTGEKTNNGMLSVLPGVAGTPGRPLKTILEYAEERGLATGVITNRPIWDATPAACYAHVDARKKVAEIFDDLLHPRFGDGVDVLVGADRKGLFASATARGLDPVQALRLARYQVLDTPEAITPDVDRVAAIYDGGDFEPGPVLDNVLEILERRSEGFFLMVEWDMHTSNLERGLNRVLVMDALIRRVAHEAPPDTLILFAADHSFDLRLRGGHKDRPLAAQVAATGESHADAPKAGSAASVGPATGAQVPAAEPARPDPVIRVDDGHTGEEILVAAQGPGAERVHGFIPNTEIFHIMLAAYGWPESP